jgi:hypothetical protein
VIVMLPLVLDDGGNCLDRSFVFASQELQLMLQVAKDDALDRNCSRSNGLAAQEPSAETKDETTQRTKPVASATPAPAALKLGPEDGSMPHFVGSEFFELNDHASCGESGGKDLPGIDADGPMLARMVHLQDASAEHRILTHGCHHLSEYQNSK